MSSKIRLRPGYTQPDGIDGTRGGKAMMREKRKRGTQCVIAEICDGSLYDYCICASVALGLEKIMIR